MLHPLRNALARIHCCDTALRRADFSVDLLNGVVPERGTGAPSFTRATTKTVRDHEGIVRTALAGEVCFQGARRVQNLLTVTSEDFSNSNWVLGDASGAKTPNTTDVAAPDGSFTALKVTLPTAGNRSFGHSAITTPYDLNGRTLQWSSYVYIPAEVVSWRMYFFTTGEVPADPIDLGTLPRNQWLRVTYKHTCTASSTAVTPQFHANNGESAGLSAYFWHPQLEDVTGQSNQNPSEYVPVGASKLNEFTNTEAIGAGWTAAAVTIPSNNNAAFNGQPVAAKLAETAASANHSVYQNISKGGTTTFLIQADMQAAERTWGVLRIDDATANGYSAFFDLQNGVLGSTTAIGAGCTVLGRGMTALGGGWYRCWIAINVPSGSTVNCQMGPGIADATPTYLGVAGSGIYVAYPLLVRNQTTPPSYYPVGNVYPYPVTMRDGSVSACCVDGVAYARYFNGNTVSSNVVTEATGAAIGLTKNQTAYVPGASGSYFSTPNAAANQITGDLELISGAIVPNWGGASTPTTLIAKWGGTTGQRSYQLTLGTTNIISFQWVDSSGSAVLTAFCSVGPSTVFPAGTAAFLKVTLAAATPNATVTFYSGPTKTGPWTQLGAPQAVASAGGVQSTTTDVEIGASIGGVANFAGFTPLYASVAAGIGGTPRLVFDPNDASTSSNTWTSSTTGETWTKNGNAQIQNNPLLGYLAEEARTNLALQSTFAATWTVGSATLTANATTAPDGTTSAAKLAETATTNSHSTSQVYTKAASALVYTFSVYLKQAERTWAELVLYDGANGNRYWFNLATGVVGSTAVIGTGFTSPTLGIQPAANGFWRCIVTATSTTSTALQTWVSASTGDTVDSYAGTAGSGIYAWGAQLEQASLATSYIPTTTAAVTRNADVLTHASAGNTDVQGTLYCEYDFRSRPVDSSQIWAAMTIETDVSNTVGIDGVGFNVSFSPRFNVRAGGVSQCATNAGPESPSAVNKCAARFATNNFGECFNGGTVALDTSGTVPTFTTINVGRSSAVALNGTIRNVRIWKTAANDALLQRLTA